MIEKIKELKEENFIWVIYLFISIFAIISNELEKKYYYFKCIKDKRLYHKINLTIFIVALLIYMYYINSHYKKLQKKEENLLPLIASILFFIGGLIFLYYEYKYYNEDEIAI